MKSVLPIALLLAGLPGSAFAAVSGFYDSAAQIEAILQSPAVGDAVRQMPIRALARTGSRDGAGAMRWRLRTDRCSVTVLLDAISPQGVGKTSYAVKTISPCK